MRLTLFQKEATTMKKNISIILAMLMLLTLSGPAMAGSDDIVNLGTAQISRGDLDRLKAMVAGDPVPAAQAPAAEYLVDLGVVQVPLDDLDQIKAMIAGTYVAPVTVAASEPMVDVGKVVISRSDLESLRLLVADHLNDVRSHLARVNLR
jgi:hypothetical protein